MSRLKRFAAVAAIGSLGLGGTALGADGPTVGEPLAPDSAESNEVRVFNFEGDTISTDFLKPGTMLIEGLRRGRRSSLIEVRMDFVAEILRSAEDI